jgi:hypothetical protein
MYGGRRMGVLGNPHKHLPELQDGGMREGFPYVGKTLPVGVFYQDDIGGPHGFTIYRGDVGR